MGVTRTATTMRKTNETSIAATLSVDGSRNVDIDTGIGFLDHMIAAFAYHAGWDLEFRCKGDLEIDDHHTAEDCAIVLGELLCECWTQNAGLTRFGSAFAPLDEALARAVVDLSGRPGAFIDLKLRREVIGTLATENLTHFWQTFATTARLTLHLDLIRGENDHHKAEAASKAFALAIRAALLPISTTDLSTKGTL